MPATDLIGTKLIILIILFLSLSSTLLMAGSLPYLEQNWSWFKHHSCLMAFRNEGYHNNGAGVTGLVTWEKLGDWPCKTSYSRVTWLLLYYLVSFWQSKKLMCGSQIHVSEVVSVNWAISFVDITGQLFMGSFTRKGGESVYIPLRKNGIKQLLQSPAHFCEHK